MNIVSRLEQMKAKFVERDVDNNGLVSFEEAKAVLVKPPFNFTAEKVTVSLLL